MHEVPRCIRPPRGGWTARTIELVGIAARFEYFGTAKRFYGRRLDGSARALGPCPDAAWVDGIVAERSRRRARRSLATLLAIAAGLGWDGAGI